MISEAMTIALINTGGIVLVAILQLLQAQEAKKERKANEQERKANEQERKEAEKYRRERDEAERLRKERDAALYSLVFADSGGTEVLLHQAHGDHLNGNVEAALDDIRDAKAALNKICNTNMANL